MGANYCLYVQVSYRYVALDSFVSSDFYDKCLAAAFYQMGTSVQVNYLAPVSIIYTYELDYEGDSKFMVSRDVNFDPNNT